MSVGMTGTPLNSANSTKRSAASALMIPPPATISGRSALVEHGERLVDLRPGRPAACTPATAAYVATSNSISASWTSIGKSIRTGPGRPDRIKWNACWNAPGTCAGSSTVIAIFVNGLAIEAMSTALEVLLVQSCEPAPDP